MSQKWAEAGGQNHFAFMGAASRILNGDNKINCPKCAKGTLRFYFHIFDKKKGTGTLWVWCHFCRTNTHLPRVILKARNIRDPFINMSLEEFAQLELSETDNFIDRLDLLWDEGKIEFLNFQK